MKRIPTTAGAAILAAITGFAGGTVAASELLPPLPALDEPILETISAASGWYLRGDVTFGATRIGRATGAPVRTTFAGTKIDDAWAVGGGIGYRYNDFLRIDATLEHRFDASFSGSSALAAAPNTLYRDRAEFSATTGLVNAYVDLGTWWSVAPYIGAGIGLAHTRFAGQTIDSCTAPCPAGHARAASPPAESRTGLAFALMAGVSVETGHGSAIEIGYRYLHLGRVRSARDASLGTVVLKDTASHDLRIGLRWSLH